MGTTSTAATATISLRARFVDPLWEEVDASSLAVLPRTGLVDLDC